MFPETKAFQLIGTCLKIKPIIVMNGGGILTPDTYGCNEHEPTEPTTEKVCEI